MDHQALRPVYYPTLAGGMRRLAEPRTLTPQTPPHFFRNMLNLVPQDGLLRRREGLGVATFGFDLGSLVVRNTTGNHQYPLAIFDLTLWPRSNGYRLIVVTDKELWIITQSGAFNITPTYTTGTITASLGSANITGAGTAWETDHVGDKVLIQIESNWYQINTVTNDTTATLSSVLTTTGGAGLNYTIRRSFWGLKLAAATAHFPWYGAHGVTILDSFYLAGMFGRYNSTGTTYVATGAVLKIDGAADPDKLTFTPADVSYLFSSQDMDAAGTMDTADRFFAPLGLEVGEDGRLIMPAHMGEDGSSDPAGAARVWYSSFDDYQAWTLSPGGAADQIQRRTKMTGIGRIGRAFALHFNDQILLASPTGAADPPLAFIGSRATVGAAGPRLRVTMPGGERCPAGDFFVAADGHTYVFNGDSSLPVNTGWRDILGTYKWTDIVLAGHSQLAHMAFDLFRREVSLFFPETLNESYERATIELRWHVDTGAMTQHRYAVPISAVSSPVYIEASGTIGNLQDITRNVGVPSYGNSVASTMLMTLSSAVLSDSAAPQLVAAETPGGVYFELDDLDFGLPHHRCVVVTVVVSLFGRATTTETLKCRVSSDDGTTFYELSKSLSLVSGAEQQAVFNFAETIGPAASKWKVRVQANSNDTFSMALRGMEVFAAPSTDTRAA